MEFLARHYEDIIFPGFDSRLNQIQGVHLKFFATLSMKFNRKSA